MTLFWTTVHCGGSRASEGGVLGGGFIRIRPHSPSELQGGGDPQITYD